MCLIITWPLKVTWLFFAVLEHAFLKTDILIWHTATVAHIVFPSGLTPPSSSIGPGSLNVGLSTMDCPSLLSITVTKTNKQTERNKQRTINMTKWEEMSLFHLHLPSNKNHWGMSGQELKQSGNLKAGDEALAGRMLLTGFLSLDCSVCFLIDFRITLPGVGLTTVGWTPPHQSVKEMLHRLA